MCVFFFYYLFDEWLKVDVFLLSFLKCWIFKAFVLWIYWLEAKKLLVHPLKEKKIQNSLARGNFYVHVFTLFVFQFHFRSCMFCTTTKKSKSRERFSPCVVTYSLIDCNCLVLKYTLFENENWHFMLKTNIHRRMKWWWEWIKLNRLWWN